MPLDVPRSQIIRMLNSNMASDVISMRLHFHNLMKIWGAEATAIPSSVVSCLSQICFHAAVAKIVLSSSAVCQFCGSSICETSNFVSISLFCN